MTTNPDFYRTLSGVEAALDRHAKNQCRCDLESYTCLEHDQIRTLAASVRRLQGERDAAKLAANEEHDRHRETCGELHLMTKRAERAEARQKGTP